MIKVESIKIEEFRGIRDLTLNLKGNNFAVCGPNGTGKSGVVDALEFALTGNISRLSGEGTDNLSIKEHAPHVDSRNAPEKARVTVTGTIPSLGKTFSIARAVKAPNSPNISPAEPEIIGVIKQMERHPEFVLTRRELIHYILSPAGKRAKEIQTLLRLDRVNQAREMLQRVANRSQRAVADATEGRDRARENLTRAIGVPTLNSEEVLREANARRATLGLAAITELTPSTSLKDGMIAAGGGKSTGKLVKSEAVADLAQLRAVLAECSSTETKEQSAAALELLNSLAANETLLRNMTKETFLRTGLEFIDDNACPFCDSEWDPEHLRAHVKEKLDRLSEIAKQRTEAEAKVRPMINILKKVKQGVDAALQYGAMATPVIDLSPLREFHSSTESMILQLETFLPLDSSIEVISTIGSIPDETLQTLTNVEKYIATIPEPTKQEAARDYLTIAQERLEAYRNVSLLLKKAQAQEELTRKTFNIYEKVSNEVLEELYREVEEDFAGLYREINKEDESGFSARLKPSLGKLGFDVDFYGRGRFPPGAYHSEGHQDGMGLCLYLALMRHLQGSSFAFAVLDDVLMSIDAGHRREVCSLLKNQFPDTQFILTTHDPVWLRHMTTEGLLPPKSLIHFRSWNVDHGPTEWDDKDVWSEIDSHLNRNDVRAAAGLLRYFLEYMGAELCHRLRASVEFRGDAQYQLGDVLPRATARLRALYKRGKDVAMSWNQKDVVSRTTDMETRFSAAVERSSVEQWQINPAIHYNHWASLQKEDFVPVVKAFNELIETFHCPMPGCQTYLHVVPERGDLESLRCDCGGISINLTKKTS